MILALALLVSLTVAKPALADNIDPDLVVSGLDSGSQESEQPQAAPTAAPAADDGGSLFASDETPAAGQPGAEPQPQPEPAQPVAPVVTAVPQNVFSLVGGVDQFGNPCSVEITRDGEGIGAIRLAGNSEKWPIPHAKYLTQTGIEVGGAPLIVQLLDQNPGLYSRLKRNTNPLLAGKLSENDVYFRLDTSGVHGVNDFGHINVIEVRLSFDNGRMAVADLQWHDEAALLHLHKSSRKLVCRLK